jgi:hypothetical protein
MKAVFFFNVVSRDPLTGKRSGKLVRELTTEVYQRSICKPFSPFHARSFLALSSPVDYGILVPDAASVKLAN